MDGAPIEQQSAKATEKPTRLSYKFQRLRERLRAAITSGELAGKLPGERELAKRFRANPKTLSKALTDLAAEGLLDRSIGRGTYVRGSGGSSPSDKRVGRWLILCEPQQENSNLVAQLRRNHADAEVIASVASVRPSFLDQFDAVIDLASNTPEAFHRNLIVRGITVMLVGREATMYRHHAVLLDRTHAAASLAREILLAGHQRIVVVEDTNDQTVSAAVRAAAGRYAPYATVESCSVGNMAALTGRQHTAVLCDGMEAGRVVHHLIQSEPQLARVSMAAVGVCDDQPICTGIFVGSSDLALAAANLLRDAQHRPTVLWLSGTYVDRGTVVAVTEQGVEQRAISA
jgi:DNA-binding transcriptional regulator YhcF (GntR family)